MTTTLTDAAYFPRDVESTILRVAIRVKDNGHCVTGGRTYPSRVGGATKLAQRGSAD